MDVLFTFRDNRYFPIALLSSAVIVGKRDVGQDIGGTSGRGEAAGEAFLVLTANTVVLFWIVCHLNTFPFRGMHNKLLTNSCRTSLTTEPS